MSQLNVTEQIRAEEDRLLQKFAEHAVVLQRRDPRLSRAAAFGRAMAELPKTYQRYSELREKMIAMRLLPRLIK
jgi:hypothetical protein